MSFTEANAVKQMILHVAFQRSRAMISEEEAYRDDSSRSNNLRRSGWNHFA